MIYVSTSAMNINQLTTELPLNKHADQIRLETGIPHCRGAYKQVWAEMNPGDSFKVPDNRNRMVAIMTGRRMGHIVKSEKLNGDGYRLWLVTKAL